MSEVARLYRYKSLLSGRGAVPTATLMAELEISPATLKRDIAKLRDQLHVPIGFDRDLGGYRLEPGLLGPKLKPLQQRLAGMLQKQGLSEEDAARRIRLLHAGKRKEVLKSFQSVAAGTLARKHLRTRVRKSLPEAAGHYV